MSVALVGNGTSLLRLKKGKEIDSHTNVIRQNLFYHLIDPDITGVKTTIWSCCFDNYCKYDIENCLNVNKDFKVWYARPMGWNSNSDKWINPTWTLDKVECEIIEAEYSNIEQIIKPLGGTHPTTGFLTLNTALKRFPKEQIDLYGYDFYCHIYMEPFLDSKNSFDVRSEPLPQVKQVLLYLSYLSPWVNNH